MHHPVTNKNNEVVCSAVTNLDLHDISRAALTYGVERFFVITPLEDQKILAQKIKDHWVSGPGSTYNPKRKQALSILSVVSSMDDAVAEIKVIAGAKPKIVATDAQKQPNSINYTQMGQMLKTGKPMMLVLGTAWGLTQDFIESADFVLDPIYGAVEYNHLSVRSAASIMLDRLAGHKQP